MKVDCRRWAELADLEATGEALPSEGRAFQRAHEATCAECAEEAAVWRALKVQAEDAAVTDAEVERLLSLAAVARADRAASVRVWKGALAAACGVLACAAAVWLWLRAPEQPGPARSATNEQHAVVSAPGAAVPSAPPVEEASSPLLARDPGPSGCSEVVPGATVCLAPGAALGSRMLTGPQRALEVLQGRVVVALAPQPAGTSFSLTGSKGKVTAVGTIFSVEVSSDGTTIARVMEGKVLVQATGDTEAQPLRAGQGLRLGERKPTPLAPSERDADLALLPPAVVSERMAVARASSSAPIKPPAKGEQPPARDMLEYARSLRARGNFRGAADVYRQIHAEAPQSASGRAALVSLGELLLTLQDPQGALSAFDTYLKGGGALTQEASFGRVRALRALNRPSEERRAIEHFVAKYPDAPQSRVLRSRLATMSE